MTSLRNRLSSLELPLAARITDLAQQKTVFRFVVSAPASLRDRQKLRQRFRKANRQDVSILDLQIWHLKEELKCARSLEPQRF
jgi:hypothetical protein